MSTIESKWNFKEASNSEKILALKLQEKDKEIEELKEELNALNAIMETQREREYHSKFLKDFQKERGKNVFPDHDEVYKRYDDYKGRVEKAIEHIEKSWNDKCTIPLEEVGYSTDNRWEIWKILKGSE